MDRAKAISRVVKLSQITVENGATEGEEEAAYERAHKLIAKYELLFDELLEAEEQEMRARGPRVQPRPQPPPAPPMPASPAGSPFNPFGGPFDPFGQGNNVNVQTGGGGTFIFISFG